MKKIIAVIEILYWLLSRPSIKNSEKTRWQLVKELWKEKTSTVEDVEETEETGDKDATPEV